MKILHLVALATLAAATGCSHGLMRGSVAMKTSDREAHVCMGNNEVKAGDKVALFKNVCVSRVGGGGRGNAVGAPSCHREKLGDGEVTQTLNEHYSVVRVDPGVQFDEGTIVEKE